MGRLRPSSRAAEKLGFDAVVDQLLAGLTEPDRAGDAIKLPWLTPLAEASIPGFNYDDYDEFMKLSSWWLDRMIVTDTPLREKLVLLLHNQFPTSYAKVGSADLMYNQNQLFRTHGPGSFEVLTQAVAKDPAMLIWLDTGTDYKAHPNENFARELMERFTMGVGNYTQHDVVQGARAFTGWTLDYTTGEFYFNQYDHDNDVKRFLGHTGRLQGEDIINIATHTEASSKWVVARLVELARLSGDPEVPHRRRARTQVPAGPQHHEPPRDHLAPSGLRSETAIKGLVKQPIEYLVGALRLLGPDDFSLQRRHARLAAGVARPAALRAPQRRRMGPEPVLVVHRGEQRPDRRSPGPSPSTPT